MTTKEAYIYLAGLVDADGSVGIINAKKKKKKRYPTPYLMVTNSYKPVLDWLSGKFGGRIQKLPDNRGMFKTTKDCYQWHLRWSNCIKLLKKIQPYMKIKKDKANEVIKFKKWKNT